MAKTFKILLSLMIVVTFASALLFYYQTEAGTSSQITATVAIGVCGNNIVEFGEDCDGSALDGQTCESLGFDGGTLSCNVGCEFNESECVNLGPDEGSVVFSGKAYPLSVVKILKDGAIAATTAADANGNFETTLSHLIVGSYSFAVYAYDNNGNKSKTITFQRAIAKDEIESISGFVVPPTLFADKEKVEQGDKITFSGQSAPLSTVSIFLDSGDGTETFTTVSNDNGFYSYKLDSDSLEIDEYAAVSRVTVIGYPVSEDSEEISFEVGENSVLSGNSQCSKKADLNGDCRINIIDFSIMIHYFKKNDFPGKVDLNADKKVDLADFSVMMYQWTA